MFQMLFERSADAIFLFDPRRQVFVDCNQAAVDMMRATGKQQLLLMHPADLSPEFQPDGQTSREKTPEMTVRALAKGSYRFEWVARRLDGTEFPLEVLATPIETGEHPLIATVCRDISERRASEKLKAAEQESRNRTVQAQKHRDVLLELAQLDKSDFQRALQKICSLAASSLEVARVSYWSLSKVDLAIVCEHLHLLATQASNEAARGARLARGDCPAYFLALDTKRPIVADQVLTHPATAGLAEGYLKPLGISSMLDAPVWVRGEVVGVLCHEHVGPARTWSAEEIDFASSLAAMVSLAVEESERATSESRLRESEEKFRALFEASSQGVILHDENKILEVNPACLRILGFRDPSEIVGKHPAEISAEIQPDGQRADVQARQYIQQCMAEGQARFDWVARNSIGDEVPIEIVLTRICWGGQQLMQAVFNDISDRKMAEAELRDSERRLRESEARFSAAFRASPVFITISRFDDGRYVLANEAFLQWTEYRLDEVLGRNSLELSIWADPAAREPFWEELRRTQSIRERECRVRNRHGQFFTVLLSADIIEVSGAPHLLTVGLDITQRKQAEADLLRTVAREKELSQLRSSFVSMVSHEFRTPLGIIQSSAEILDDYLERLEPAERKEHLVSIKRNTRRMAALMEEVLLLGRFDAGRMEFRPERLDLSHFVRRVLEEVLVATDQRCPIELSLGNMQAETQGDERLLRHIFINLLTNAVKYSDSGRAVKFEIGCNGTEIICVVRDRGIGIPEPDREWLFHPFHRGRNVGDRPGSGLGLVIVKRCVDLHGGTIQVESELGTGTSVIVRFPLVK